MTLVIIGVIAGLTVPSLNSSASQKQLKAGAQKAFSTMNQAVDRATNDLGFTPSCFYWESSAKPNYSLRCKGYNDQGYCTGWETTDGNPLPSDTNGKSSNCALLNTALLKSLNIVKTCQSSALANGCIPPYKGGDTVYAENNPGKTGTLDCSYFSESSIRNNMPAYVLADGTILVPHGNGNPQLFFMDVNGKKGPNKWGYDLFTIELKGDGQGSLRFAQGRCYITQKGGSSLNDMLTKN